MWGMKAGFWKNIKKRWLTFFFIISNDSYKAKPVVSDLNNIADLVLIYKCCCMFSLFTIGRYKRWLFDHSIRTRSSINVLQTIANWDVKWPYQSSEWKISILQSGQSVPRLGCRRYALHIKLAKSELYASVKIFLNDNHWWS